MNRHHRHLRCRPVNPPALTRSNQVAESNHRRHQAAHECRHRPRLDPAGPALIGLAVVWIQELLESVDQIRERLDDPLPPVRGDQRPRSMTFGRIPQYDRTRNSGNIYRIPAQLGFDPLCNKQNLIAGVGGIGEDERQQAFVDEFTRCPSKDSNVLTPGGVGDRHVARTRPRRSPQRHRGKR